MDEREICSILTRIWLDTNNIYPMSTNLALHVSVHRIYYLWWNLKDHSSQFQNFASNLQHDWLYHDQSQKTKNLVSNRSYGTSLCPFISLPLVLFFIKDWDLSVIVQGFGYMNNRKNSNIYTIFQMHSHKETDWLHFERHLTCKGTSSSLIPDHAVTHWT